MRQPRTHSAGASVYGAGVRNDVSDRLEPGWFVEVEDRRRLGKVHALRKDLIAVEFFHSIAAREVEEFDPRLVRRSHLSRQTRVYFRLDPDERWAMGRVLDVCLRDDGSVTYKVRTPNRRESEVPESRLAARCFTSANDPLEVLGIGAAETQLWHDARWVAKEALTTLRSAAMGLTGLTSASVDLVAHQADAVRRVLTDPLQRYLLADEVGLGKTIEAGAVIRQLLIDEPSRRVLVSVPATLLAQWRHELLAKFDLDPEVDERVRLISHPELASVHESPDLLIIDEAHRIDPHLPDAVRITRLVERTPKLLLLSATPILGQEQTLLDLLRWLDPGRWAGETVQAFRTHLAKRQDYGRLLLGLQANANPYVLKQRAAAARTAFPSDPVVAELSEALLANIDQPAGRTEACAALREHIADAYRIHNRIIRSRRADLEGWEFQPRGPAAVREESDDDPRLPAIAAALEDWRVAAAAHAETGADADALADRFALLLDWTGRGVPALARSLTLLIPAFSGEAELIGELRRLAGGDEPPLSRAKLVATIAERQVRFLRRTTSAPKLVVFVTDPEEAAQIAAALRSLLGNDASLDLSGGAERLALERFETNLKVSVAVFDAAGEEGLNLHFADAILHTDLPFSVTRLEQRIGRLDRFGRLKGAIQHSVLLPEGEDDGPWSAWLRLLREGFGLFDRPLSDVQFVLDPIERQVKRALLMSGGAALEEHAKKVEAHIAEEREQLDEQYALDQLAMSREPARALVEAMESAEEDESDLADRLKKILVDLLQFRPVPIDRWDVFELHWTFDTLLPERPWKPLFEAALRRPLTWRRRIAAARPGVSLLRPGALLVDTLERLLEWDDRGTAFATWRYEPAAGGPGEEQIVFRLCWIVAPGEVDGRDLLAAEDPAGLRRRAAAFLKPWSVVQHLRADLAPIESTEMHVIVERRYSPVPDASGRRDVNLGSRPDWLHEVMDRVSFGDLCARMHQEGLRRLKESESWRERTNAALSAARQDDGLRRRRLEARLADADDPAVRRDLALNAAMLRAVAEPRARLDAAGVFVVAGYVPEARE
jgi:ATP-dependent helicase HepA